MAETPYWPKEPIDMRGKSFKADAISESTSAAGVTLDGVRCVDNAVHASAGFGSNAATLQFAGGAAGAATFGGNASAHDLTGRRSIYAGVFDSVAGQVYIYSEGAGSAVGGKLFLYTAPDHDDSIAHYSLRVEEDDLLFYQGSTTRLTLQGATGAWYFAGDIDLAATMAIQVGGSDFIQYVNTSTIVMGIGAALAGADDESVIIGDNAGAALTTGDDRMTVIGHNAALAWTSDKSVVIGFGSANTGTGGSLDVLIGNSVAGVGSFTGTRTTAVGAQCARDLTSSNDSCYYGYRSGDSVTTGDEEAIFGASAGLTLTTQDKNSYFGKSSGEGATSHSGAYFGYKAGFTGPGNLSVCLGPYAGYHETGDDKLFIDNAQRTNEADGRVKALIYGVFAAATADQSVTINGDLNVRESIDLLVATTATAGQITQAGARILHTYGTSNLFVGTGAGNFTLTGSGTVAAGYHVLEDLTSGVGNIVFGYTAAANLTTSPVNIFIGYQAADTNAITGTGDNIGIGTRVLRGLTSGRYNVVIGRQSGESITDGLQNTIVGYLAGSALGSNSYVTCLGSRAGDNCVGDSGVFLGYAAGHFETAANKLFIDNAPRGGEADGRVKALIYGVFAAAVADQSVTVNGLLSSRYGASFGDVVTNFMQVTSGGLTTWHGTAGIPHAEMWVLGNAVATAIAGAGTFAQFVGFANDGNALDAVSDHTNDHITITTAGKYLVVASFHVESIGAGAADIVSIEIRKNNGTVSFNNLHAHRKLAGGGGDVGSISISGIADLAATDTVEVWLTNDDNATDILVADANLSVVQIGGT